MRKICSILLAIFLAAAMAVPARASEETIPPQSGEQVETPPESLSSDPVEFPVEPEESSEEPEFSPEPEFSLEPEFPTEPEEPSEFPEEWPEMDGLAEEDTSVVQVTVPQIGRVIINPYGLPVEIDGTTSREQIASETLTIENTGEVPVVVQAAATAYAAGGVVYVPQLPSQSAAAKEVFVYAEFQKAGNGWLGNYYGAENQILISEGIGELKEVLVLDAGPSQGIFRLFGGTTMYPEIDWSTDDRISVTFTFTFIPIDEFAPDRTLDDELTGPEEIPVPEESELPMPEETEPPAPEETEPPAPEETEPPAPEETEPPTPEETEPPAPEETEPPAPEETEPPMPEETEPPAPEETEPPAPTEAQPSEKLPEPEGDHEA